MCDHLYTCEWYGRALRFVLRRRPAVTRIVLVSCASHLDPGPLAALLPSPAAVRAHCGDFRDRYVRFFRAQTRLPVTVACGTLEEDLCTLHHSTALIAAAGSFAYYAGLSSDNLFVVPDVFGAVGARPNMHVLRGGRIDHMAVVSYADRREMAGHMGCSAGLRD